MAESHPDPQPPQASQPSPQVLVAPAEPPRELSAAVRRRAWTEPRVRLWWILAAGVLLLTVYVAITEAAAWWAERRLLTHGVAVQAVIVRATTPLNDITVPDKKMPPDSVCTMEFELNGQKHTVRGELKEHLERGQHVTTGPDHPVTLRVDPEDPQRWTDRTQAPPLLSRQLIGVAIGLPIVVLLALLALLKRRGLLEVWRNGPSAAALVLETGQTPVAPGARSVRCTLTDARDKRVFTVYVPGGGGAAVAAGDVLWVIHPPGRQEPAYAAAWFDRDGAASAQPA